MSEKKAQGIEPDLVRELADILRASDLSEIEVEHGELKLRLTRAVHMVAAAPVHHPIQHAVHAAPAPMAAAPAPIAAAEAPAAAKDLTNAVKSPMVGTAFLSPEPGAPAFVKIGDKVNEGQTLMIVEAMKTFNPIPATRAGTVKEILIADGHPVEFGQPLMIIE